MLDASRIFEVGAGLPRPELSQLLGAETSPLLGKKDGTPKRGLGREAVRRYENRPVRLIF